MDDIRKQWERWHRGKWVFSDGLAFFARLILGAIFIYAATGKILDPHAFAETVYKYRILPQFLLNITAIILPWLEVSIAVCLILGIWLPGAVLMSNFLLVCFLGLLVFSMARGLDIHCGCFSASANGTNHVSMAWYVTRDSLFLLLACYLFYRTFRGKMGRA